VRRKKRKSERIRKKNKQRYKKEKIRELVNKERKRRIRINKELSLTEWREYFIEILGEVERKMIRKGKKRKWKLIRKNYRIIREMKEGKTMEGKDGILSKVYKVYISIYGNMKERK